MFPNLNKVVIPGDVKWQRLISAKSVSTNVYFDDLEQHLIDHILGSEICLGCVAWLTNENVLNALSASKKVSILVQKEDFLRPDSCSNEKLKSLYSKLPALSLDDLNNMGGLGITSDFVFPCDCHQFEPYDEELAESFGKGFSTYIASEQSREVVGSCKNFLKNEASKLPTRSVTYASFSDDECHAIRCVGNLNADRSPAMPRMHHKFMLFCDKYGVPYQVWTGSFNFTQNGTRSLENAVVISEPSIVAAYWQEWAYVYALSENLDWMQEWCNPIEATWRS